MVDVSSMTDEELLRQSIRNILTERRGIADVLLNSMYGGLAIADRPTMLAVWNEELSPEQAEVDLHLTGESVHGHGTRADQLSIFVSGINDATKAIVRDKLGLRTLSRNLIIEGIQPGSVKVVLRADSPLPDESTVTTIPDADASSPDSLALRTVARIFTTASSDEPGVGAELRTLPAGAREGIKRAVAATRTARWEISGEIRQRGYGSSAVSLSQIGAKQIIEQLENHNWDTNQGWVSGRVDGFRHSLGSFYLVPASSLRPVQISVPDPGLLKKVRQLAAVEGAAVDALVETVFPVGETSARPSRTLLDIRPGTHPALPPDVDDAGSARVSR
jgi:hypothetical protein